MQRVLVVPWSIAAITFMMLVSLIHSSFLFNFFVELLAFNVFFAFKELTTFLPVFSSISFRIFPAILPPCFAKILFSIKFFGLFYLLISVVVAYASIFKTNLRLVYCLSDFSFSTLCSLYFTENPLHAFVISSVNIAYSCPFLTPRESHSSVSSFLTSILFSR